MRYDLLAVAGALLCVLIFPGSPACAQVPAAPKFAQPPINVIPWDDLLDSPDTRFLTGRSIRFSLKKSGLDKWGGNLNIRIFRLPQDPDNNIPLPENTAFSPCLVYFAYWFPTKVTGGESDLHINLFSPDDAWLDVNKNHTQVYPGRFLLVFDRSEKVETDEDKHVFRLNDSAKNYFQKKNGLIITVLDGESYGDGSSDESSWRTRAEKVASAIQRSKGRYKDAFAENNEKDNCYRTSQVTDPDSANSSQVLATCDDFEESQYPRLD
jgi:hypothetical protein